jgi:MYXO-CTERM domain-containing protein
MTRLFVATALGAAMFCAGPARAEIVIDDFLTDNFSEAFAAAPADANYFRVQNGAMAGGQRLWNLLLRGADNLGATVEIGDGSFRFHSDMGVGHRFDWYYGTPNALPLTLDLSGESTLRFQFLEAARGLNFNVLLYYRGEYDNYSQLGVNIAPHNTPFNVDFSFADFAAAIADPSRPADFSHVSHIYIVTQSGGYYAGGGESFAITSISAVPEAPGWALVLAGVAALAGLQRRRAATAELP